MVYPGIYLRGTRNRKQGEVALTLAVLSVMVMIIGTVAGIGVNTTQDVRSKAAGNYCGIYCDDNRDCGRDSTSGSDTQCNVSKPKNSVDRVCVSVNLPSNPKCPTGLKKCGESCNADYNCNAGLTCDRNKKVCSGSACPVASPTPSGTGGGGGSSGPTSGAGGGGGTGGGFPTLAPTGAIGGSTVGTAFRVLELSCKVEFQFKWDPQLVALRISDPNNPGNVFVAHNNPSRISPSNCNFGPLGKTITFPSGGTAGIYVEFDPSKNSSDLRITTNGGGGAECSVVHYYFPMPAWMVGSARYNVEIEYEGKVAGVKRHWMQVGRSQACTTVTPSVVTPTVPTPSTKPPACGDRCTEGITNCGLDSTGRYQLECRKPNPNDKFAYCLLPAYVGAFCAITTPTVPTTTRTPTPSRTPTPTMTTTPTATPTPPICRKSIYFMIDSSSTQTDNIDKITKPLNDFFKGKKFKDVSFSYDTFNVVAPRERGSGFETIQFSITNGQNWTNIQDAFEVMSGHKEGARILISDGIPSVYEPNENVRSLSGNKKLVCVYSNGGKNAYGCSPVWDTPGQTGNSMPAVDCKKQEVFGANFNLHCTEPYPLKANAGATHAVVLGGEEGANSATFSKSGASQPYMQSMTDLTNNLGNIIANAPCDPENGPGFSGDSQRIRTFMSTFTVQNQSSKAVKSIDVKTCNGAGGSCQSFTNNIGVQPQNVGRFSQIIPDSVTETNRALVTCDVNYADGSSLPCPRKQTQNESVQFNLTLNNRAVSGSAQTFSQAADINRDGRVNSIDYALCQQQLSGTGRKTCDIVSDNLVNAQDMSVVVERLGQTAQ